VRIITSQNQPVLDWVNSMIAAEADRHARAVLTFNRDRMVARLEAV
jgi:hypothetical protein